MKKLLILFSSTDGHTKIIAETIAQHLSENYCADIVRIADSQTFPLDHYDLIIIGASIRYGKFKPELYSFIDQHMSLLCLLYTSPSPRDSDTSRMPSSA